MDFEHTLIKPKLSSINSHKDVNLIVEYKDYRTSEGDVKYIPFRGSVHETVKKILGGLRSACTYTDSKNPMDLKKAELIYLK